MMLVGDDIEPDIVTQPVFVKDLVVEPGGDLRVAIFVGQAGAHRWRRIEHLGGDKGVGVLAMVPQFHAAPLRRLVTRYFSPYSLRPKMGPRAELPNFQQKSELIAYRRYRICPMLGGLLMTARVVPIVGGQAEEIKWDCADWPCRCRPATAASGSRQ